MWISLASRLLDCAGQRLQTTREASETGLHADGAVYCGARRGDSIETSVPNIVGDQYNNYVLYD